MTTATEHAYHEVLGFQDEGTIILMLLDGRPPVPLGRRMMDHLAESRGWPDGCRGFVRRCDPTEDSLNEDGCICERCGHQAYVDCMGLY